MNTSLDFVGERRQVDHLGFQELARRDETRTGLPSEWRDAWNPHHSPGAREQSIVTHLNVQDTCEYCAQSFWALQRESLVLLLYDRDKALSSGGKSLTLA